jgi:hypothetical protein
MNININNTGAVLRAGKVSNGPNQSKKNFSGQKREPKLQSDLMHVAHTNKSEVGCFSPI